MYSAHQFFLLSLMKTLFLEFSDSHTLKFFDCSTKVNVLLIPRILRKRKENGPHGPGRLFFTVMNVKAPTKYTLLDVSPA